MNRDFLRRIFLPWSHDSILYEVTPRCNLQCLHCYNVWKDDVGYAEKELSTEQARKLIRKAIRDSRCRQFTFTGGEPAIRDDLEELVALAKSKCESVALITNGTLLSEARVKSLIGAGVSLFELPLNSADRAMHNRLAGGHDCFDKVTRAAADIRYQGAELAFVFVGTSLNIEHWKGALELGIALGARGFLFNRYNAGGSAHGNPETLMPAVEQVRAGLRVAEDYAAKYGLGIGASIAIPPCLIEPKEFPHVGFGFCAAGTDRAYYTMDPLGNVRPCNHTPTILGNLFKTSLKAMTRSKVLFGFKEARPEFCRGCGLERECLGGCKAAAEACYGSLSACEPFLELNKTLARRRPDRTSKNATAQE
ncbi:MAG: radical SAM protein [Lentisphaerae bacterium]|nr:radical SAM protein [Lentisphaerota bacterium]